MISNEAATWVLFVVLGALWLGVKMYRVQRRSACLNEMMLHGYYMEQRYGPGPYWSPEARAAMQQEIWVQFQDLACRYSRQTVEWAAREMKR